MQKVDYYESLGITRAASHDEVKQAYRRLALVPYTSHRNITPIKTRTKRKQKLFSRK
jgi:DnaJ-class molecular chaperone